MRSRQSGPVFIIRLRAEPKVGAIRALRGALKVLLRRFGLRTISVRAESDQEAAPTTEGGIISRH
jgi:hypothetical protein